MSGPAVRGAQRGHMWTVPRTVVWVLRVMLPLEDSERSEETRDPAVTEWLLRFREASLEVAGYPYSQEKRERLGALMPHDGEMPAALPLHLSHGRKHWTRKQVLREIEKQAGSRPSVSTLDRALGLAVDKGWIRRTEAAQRYAFIRLPREDELPEGIHRPLSPEKPDDLTYMGRVTEIDRGVQKRLRGSPSKP